MACLTELFRPLCCMTFGNPINNLKNPSTGELKICRIRRVLLSLRGRCNAPAPSAFAGSVEGEEEVFIFIERVKKGDIHVRFFELDQDEERVWEELAEFQEGDVHHQYAIAFKTPRWILAESPSPSSLPPSGIGTSTSLMTWESSSSCTVRPTGPCPIPRPSASSRPARRGKSSLELVQAPQLAPSIREAGVPGATNPLSQTHRTLLLAQAGQESPPDGAADRHALPAAARREWRGRARGRGQWQ